MLIGVIPNLSKPDALPVCQDVISWLRLRNCDVLLSQTAADRLGYEGLGADDEQLAEACDLIIVLGGDGTLLSVVRRWPFWGVPVLGINLGNLGFLTELELPELHSGLERVLRGDYSVQERLMLRAQVKRGSRIVSEMYALNDVVVTRGSLSRLLRLDVMIDGEYLDRLPADGVIVSTPTGSTAYSLSAGGPIVDPRTSVLLVTPICAHTLHSRPLVVSPESTISIVVAAPHEDVLLSMDGQESFRLSPDDQVIVGRSPTVARFIRLRTRSFYEVLRKKLRDSGLSHGPKEDA
ncbi:MAG: NAD(+)/NADH kinase [Bacillota bacterium]|jgi:NAD+ kinase